MTIVYQDPRPLDVVVIGAGIAGLTAAIALSKQGHRVVVLEKSKFARETGAAIHVPPNCTALLEWMGVSPPEFGGTLLNQMSRFNYKGELMYQKEFGSVRDQWQAEWYLVHRVDLHNNLKSKALEKASLHTGCTIIDIDITTSQPAVTLDDGRRFECDVLLGADGLHSITRTKVAPGSSPPKPVGKSCLRWLLPTEKLRSMDLTEEVVRNPGEFVEWAGSDRRLVAYPCSDNRVFNLCGFLPTSEAGGQGEGWQGTGSKAALTAGFSQFAPAVQELAATAGDDLKSWDLFAMQALPTWVNGRCAILGDAAHPFQPFMGQGAAMAIEDAVSLATLLPLGTRGEDIPTRLALYEKTRRPRIDMVMEFTRLNGRDEDGDESVKRITPKEMIEFLTICVSHNELKNSRAVLEGGVVWK